MKIYFLVFESTKYRMSHSLQNPTFL